MCTALQELSDKLHRPIDEFRKKMEDRKKQFLADKPEDSSLSPEMKEHYDRFEKRIQKHTEKFTKKSHELTEAFRSSAKRFFGFRGTASSFITRNYQQAIQEKERIFDAVRNELQLSIDELWKSFRVRQWTLAQQSAMLKTHELENRSFLLGEKIDRRELMLTESETYMKLEKICTAEEAVLHDMLEGFKPVQPAHLDHRDAEVNGSARTCPKNDQNDDQNRLVVLEKNEETSWNELMVLAANSKSAIIFSSAVADLVYFESHNRDALTIASSVLFSDIYSAFLSEACTIMLAVPVTAETKSSCLANRQIRKANMIDGNGGKLVTYLLADIPNDAGRPRKKMKRTFTPAHSGYREPGRLHSVTNFLSVDLPVAILINGVVIFFLLQLLLLPWYFFVVHLRGGRPHSA